MFAHLNATLQGLTTIRAFDAGEILTKEFDHHQDLHSSAWFMFIASSRAFGFWLDVVCVLYIALVAFSFLLMPLTPGGKVGLAITQSIGLTGMFQWGMRQSAELENQMTSVERVSEYRQVELIVIVYYIELYKSRSNSDDRTFMISVLSTRNHRWRACHNISLELHGLSKEKSSLKICRCITDQRNHWC